MAEHPALGRKTKALCDGAGPGLAIERLRVRRRMALRANSHAKRRHGQERIFISDAATSTLDPLASSWALTAAAHLS